MMKKFLKQNIRFCVIFALVLVIAASALFVYYFKHRDETKIARADLTPYPSGNVWGWAWDSNIGWISFNSVDCDIDEDREADVPPDPAGCLPGGASPPGIPPYDVNIDRVTGDFSGYAWNQYFGWIYFGPDNGLVQIADAPEAPFEWATVNVTTSPDPIKDITGWAVILDMSMLPDDRGWIKMSDDGVGVWSGLGVKLNVFTNQFSGFAWNANNDGSGVGLISFNCSNPHPGFPGGVCGISDYKVFADINTPPSVVSTAAPNWGYQEPCDENSPGVLFASLEWVVDDPDPGSSQSAYRIVLSENNDPMTPTKFNTGRCTGIGVCDGCGDPDLCRIAATAEQYPVDNMLPLIYTIDYDKPYYWWVQVWDNFGAFSSLTQFSTSISGTLTNNINQNIEPETFTTWAHEFPEPVLVHWPKEPGEGEQVLLISSSTRYTDIEPAVSPLPCDDTTCVYEWTFQESASVDIIEGNPSGPPPAQASSSLIVILATQGVQGVTLGVHDNPEYSSTAPYYDGYYCATTTPVISTYELPSWKEVRPRPQ